MTNANLDNLTKEEKELVASILKEYSSNGSSDQLTSLLYLIKVDLQFIMNFTS